MWTRQPCTSVLRLLSHKEEPHNLTLPGSPMGSLLKMQTLGSYLRILWFGEIGVGIRHLWFWGAPWKQLLVNRLQYVKRRTLCKQSVFVHCVVVWESTGFEPEDHVQVFVQSIPVEYILYSGHWGEPELLERLNFSTKLGYMGHEATPRGKTKAWGKLEWGLGRDSFRNLVSEEIKGLWSMVLQKDFRRERNKRISVVLIG